MHKLLSHHLFQYKNCALPQIGTLYIKREPAVSVLGEQKIHAPVNKITFTSDITDSRSFTEYIAANKNISLEEAAYQLNNISNEILQIKAGNKFLIEGVGFFTKSQNDQLLFSEIKEAQNFTPAVYAERVIHPDDSHAILVGDKETDRNSMTEFFTDTIPVKKSKWWLWAAAIFVISIVVILFYLNDENHNKFFGVSHQSQIMESPNQYKNIP